MQLRIAVLFCALLLNLVPARANYVNSGSQDFLTAGSTSCVPTVTNGGIVHAGDRLVMAVQANSATGLTVTSTRATWGSPDNSTPSGSIRIYMYSAIAATSGAETIVASFTSGTALIGSACGEWSSPTIDTSSYTGLAAVNITTTQATEDLVAFGTSGVGGTTMSAPFTQRETIDFGGTTFAVLGDRQVTSTGTYTASFGGSGGHQSIVEGFWGTVSSARKGHATIIRFELLEPRLPATLPRRTI